MPSSEHPGARPRYVSERSFPPYSYVPGLFPHPIRDSAGHLFGREEPPPAPLDPRRWQESTAYLYGLDLFNHGYYWEAHEVWEGLWHACERGGTTAQFFKALIKLAAAGVKVREGKPEGVRRHAARACELFQAIRKELQQQNSRFLGLDLEELAAQSTELAARPPRQASPSPNRPVEIVFDFILRAK